MKAILFWLADNPQFTTLVVVPMVYAMIGALANAVDTYTASRWPRFAGVMRALFPHLQAAARAYLAKPYSGAAPGHADPPAVPSAAPEVKS